MISSSIPQPTWESRIPDADWMAYCRVIREARSAGIRFAFGGGFATAVYTGQFRNTKDFDFYILPEDRDRMKEAISRAGLQDYFERLPYDRSWIYRASRGDVIVDAIWQMANYRAPVDPEWLSRGPEVTLRDERLRAIPIEELVWSKLYIIQRERCDWSDVLNLIDAQADAIDYDRLADRLSEDLPLLSAALLVYGWLAPDRSGDIPADIWSRLALPRPSHDPDPDLPLRRANLLDSRPWFRVTE